MSASQLSLYNEALTVHLGERKLASLTENREPRRVLDDVWAAGAREYCLEQGDWKFAQRISKLIYTSSITPTFGYTYAFEKPTDFVKLSMLCSDEYLTQPLTRYSEETGYWFAGVDEIYVSYVSKHTSYGFDLARWPESFTRYVAAYLAAMAARRITQSKTTEDDVKKGMKALLSDARSKDAMQGPTKFLPEGSWTAARRGQGGGERGPGGSLFG